MGKEKKKLMVSIAKEDGIIKAVIDFMLESGDNVIMNMIDQGRVVGMDNYRAKVLNDLLSTYFFAGVRYGKKFPEKVKLELMTREELDEFHENSEKEQMEKIFGKMFSQSGDKGMFG